MRLSEAIREGAQWGDVHGPLMDYDGAGNCVCCALGGAAMAVGLNGNRLSKLRRMFPLLDKAVEYPGVATYCVGRTEAMWECIAWLFETERPTWSKKAIAEWVEVIENKLEAERAQGSSAAAPAVVEAPASVGSPAPAQVEA